MWSLQPEAVLLAGALLLLQSSTQRHYIPLFLACCFLMPSSRSVSCGACHYELFWKANAAVWSVLPSICAFSVHCSCLPPVHPWRCITAARCESVTCVYLPHWVWSIRGKNSLEHWSLPFSVRLATPDCFYHVKACPDD